MSDMEPEALKDQESAYRLFLGFAIANCEGAPGDTIALAETLPQDLLSLMLMVRAGLIYAQVSSEVIATLSQNVEFMRPVSAGQLLREMALDAARPDFSLDETD